MNLKIFATLTERYSTSYRAIEKMAMTDMLDYLINNNPDAYLMNTRTMGKLYDEEELALFEEAKEDAQLEKLFQEVKADIVGDHDGLVEKFKKEILDSLQMIKQEVSTKRFAQKNQIIFLEHDHRPFFYWCGFGEGDYPLLPAPKYIPFSQEEFYNGIGSIDFSEYWTRIDALEEYMHDLEIGDAVLDAEPYEQFRNAYRSKLYLLLQRAFNAISLEAFEGIPIKLPLYIYANEHDRETMNIYVYE